MTTTFGVSWLDGLLGGTLRRLLSRGAAVPERPDVNFASPLRAVDNPGSGRTDVDAPTVATGPGPSTVADEVPTYADTGGTVLTRGPIKHVDVAGVALITPRSAAAATCVGSTSGDVCFEPGPSPNSGVTVLNRGSRASFSSMRGGKRTVAIGGAETEPSGGAVADHVQLWSASGVLKAFGGYAAAGVDVVTADPASGSLTRGATGVTADHGPTLTLQCVHDAESGQEYQSNFGTFTTSWLGVDDYVVIYGFNHEVKKGGGRINTNRPTIWGEFEGGYNNGGVMHYESHWDYYDGTNQFRMLGMSVNDTTKLAVVTASGDFNVTTTNGATNVMRCEEGGPVNTYVTTRVNPAGGGGAPLLVNMSAAVSTEELSVAGEVIVSGGIRTGSQAMPASALDVDGSSRSIFGTNKTITRQERSSNIIQEAYGSALTEHHFGDFGSHGLLSLDITNGRVCLRGATWPGGYETFCFNGHAYTVGIHGMKSRAAVSFKANTDGGTQTDWDCWGYGTTEHECVTVVPSSDLTINGIKTYAIHGQRVTLRNNHATRTITLKHSSGVGTNGLYLYFHGAADLVIPAGGYACATLFYDTNVAGGVGGWLLEHKNF